MRGPRGGPRGARRPSRRAAALAAAPAARGLGLVPVRKRTGTNPRSHSEVNFKKVVVPKFHYSSHKTYVQGCSPQSLN